MAPTNPIMAIINRKIPHATIPPTIGRLVTMLEAFPYVATPIKMKPTTWEIYKYYKLLLKNKFAINSLTM